LPGQLFEHKADNIISNVYTFKLVNKTVADIEDVSFRLKSHKGTIKLVSGELLNIPEQGLAEGTLFIEINASALSGDKDRLEIEVLSGDKVIETTTTAFLGPRSYK
jgi:hypothetical protein